MNGEVMHDAQAVTNGRSLRAEASTTSFGHAGRKNTDSAPQYYRQAAKTAAGVILALSAVDSHTSPALAQQQQKPAAAVQKINALPAPDYGEWKTKEGMLAVLNRTDCIQTHNHMLQFLRDHPETIPAIAPELAHSLIKLLPWDVGNCNTVVTLLDEFSRNELMPPAERDRVRTHLRATLLMHCRHEWQGWIGIAHKHLENMPPPTKADVEPILAAIGRHKEWGAWSPISVDVAYRELARIGPEAGAATDHLIERMQERAKAANDLGERDETKQWQKFSATQYAGSAYHPSDYDLAFVLGSVGSNKAVPMLLGYLKGSVYERKLALVTLEHGNDAIITTATVDALLPLLKANSVDAGFAVKILTNSASRRDLHEKTLPPLFALMGGNYNRYPRVRDIFLSLSYEDTATYLWPIAKGNDVDALLAQRLLSSIRKLGNRKDILTEPQRHTLLDDLPTSDKVHGTVKDGLSVKDYSTHVHRLDALSWEGNSFVDKTLHAYPKHAQRKEKGIAYAIATVMHDPNPYVAAESCITLCSMPLEKETCASLVDVLHKKNPQEVRVMLSSLIHAGSGAGNVLLQWSAGCPDKDQRAEIRAAHDQWQNNRRPTYPR